MAIDVHTLLTLPSSKAFTSFRSSSHGAFEDTRSDSPPRKTPRLAADSDSASASRSRAGSANNDRANEGGGVVTLKLQGLPSKSLIDLVILQMIWKSGGILVKPVADSVYDAQYNLVKASVRILLNDPGELPASYDKIFSACRAVVCEANRGEGLYENVKMSLEQCVGRMYNQVYSLEVSSTDRLRPFVENCEWFEGRVVCVLLTTRQAGTHSFPEPVGVPPSVSRPDLCLQSQRPPLHTVCAHRDGHQI